MQIFTFDSVFACWYFAKWLSSIFNQDLRPSQVFMVALTSLSFSLLWPALITSVSCWLGLYSVEVSSGRKCPVSCKVMSKYECVCERKYCLCVPALYQTIFLSNQHKLDVALVTSSFNNPCSQILIYDNLNILHPLTPRIEASMYAVYDACKMFVLSP